MGPFDGYMRQRGAGLLPQVPDAQTLARLPWQELMELRRLLPDAAMQQQLAPFEHRAYAREEVARNPLLAPAYVAMVPGYQLLKAIKGGARTPPSVQQVGHGWLGIVEGLKDAAASVRDTPVMQGLMQALTARGTP